jgi:hypothetical protein
LADGEDLYELPLGSHRITTGDQGDAWAWRVDRTIAEQLAETARDDAETSARVGPVRCDWHAEHGADDRPTGQRCEAPATRGTMRPADGAGEGGPVDQVAAQATAIVDVPAPGGAREVLTADLAPREPNVNAALATVGPLYTTEEAEQLNVQFEQSEDGCGNVELIPIPGVDGELG